MISPDQLKEAEERWKKLRDAGDPAAAEAHEEFQRLARTQTEQLQQAHQRSFLSQLLKN